LATKRRHELVATAAGRAPVQARPCRYGLPPSKVRVAMGARLTADLHGAIDRSMEKLAAL
jgi:hypothetical protein